MLMNPRKLKGSSFIKDETGFFKNSAEVELVKKYNKTNPSRRWKYKEER